MYCTANDRFYQDRLGTNIGKTQKERCVFLDEHDAVLTFSANFACRTEGCAPNILNAGYGANLLPVRFLAVSE